MASFFRCASNEPGRVCLVAVQPLLQFAVLCLELDDASALVSLPQATTQSPPLQIPHRGIRTVCVVCVKEKRCVSLRMEVERHVQARRYAISCFDGVARMSGLQCASPFSS